jgi:pyruvate ferredoxin oxidoreductase gamma subunit
MIEIRIHGRGGQGNVVAAYLLAAAAFDAGMQCQAFPAFGAERRGAPVVAFVRLSGMPIQRRNQVRQPAYLIIQDRTLLHEPGLTDGLLPGGAILLNANLSAEEATRLTGRPTVTLAATAMALDTVGKDVPNVPLLSAFLTLTGLVPHASLAHALAQRFQGEVLEKNQRLIDLAADKVPAGLWKEDALAASA